MSSVLEFAIDELEWVNDSAVKSCQVCDGRFSTLSNRKHHCRHCGSVVCQSCSPKTIRLGSALDCRVCSLCYTDLGRLRAAALELQPLTMNFSFKDAFMPLDMYVGVDDPFETELWISADLLLLCYRDVDGVVKGIPTSRLLTVEQGICNDSLEARTTQQSFCCLTSEDKEFSKCYLV